MARERIGRGYRIPKCFPSLFLLVAATAAGMAQLPTASILGVARDSTGAVVPGVALTARNTDTGQTRSTVSGADGSYRFAALPVGSYEVRAEHPGFRAEVRSGLTLTISQEAVVNFTLQVGAIEQTVAVTAEAPLVNTTSGSLGGLVDSQKIADLPLNGRNYIDLTLLQPGVTQHANINTSSLSNQGTQFSSNGAPTRSNNYLLDGAMMQNLYGTSSASATTTTLGVEGIREYRVVTNSFSAEYGMTMGSQMVIVSKSGTNNFHGSLFEYLRNSALDARNFFDYKTLSTPGRLPPFKRNNFGASFGGPIKKDKTFFFGTYEGLRERKGITTILTAIPATCRTFTGNPCATSSSGNVDPVIRPFLAIFPVPNLPNSQHTLPFTQPTAENYGQIRVDQGYSGSDNLFVRYTIDDAQKTAPGSTELFPLLFNSRNQFATLSEDHVFSPAILNTARFSFSRTKLINATIYGVQDPALSFFSGAQAGIVTVGGVSGIGPFRNSPILLKQNIFTWSDDLFYNKGRHSLKFGALINHFQQFMDSNSNPTGTAAFTNLASFLANQLNNFSGTTPGSLIDRTYHFTTLGFYGQDDLRLASRLTLNLGLRYEFMTQIQEVNGFGVAIRDPIHDAQTALGPTFLNPTKKNVSPRLGFAWDVRGNGKTAVRGGFGILYDVASWGNALAAGVPNASPPFSNQSTVRGGALSVPMVIPAAAAGKTLRALDYQMNQPRMMSYNLTVDRQLPFSMALSVAYAGSRGSNIAVYSEANPNVAQVQSDGRLFWPVNTTRRNLNWDSIIETRAIGDSWYDSLQITLQKRLSKGLQFQSSYTWGKSLDETNGQSGADAAGSSTFASNPYNLSQDKGPSFFNVGQNWRFNALYRFPTISASNRVAEKLLNGWWISSIVARQTGYPFDLTLNSNRSRAGVNGGGGGVDRPDLLPGRNNSNITSGTTSGCQGVLPGQRLGTVRLYYDPCAFAIPGAGFLGNLSRGFLAGPKFFNLDFSIVKNTALRFLGESGRVEFRTEFFNLLNHPDFGLPGSSIFAATANAEAPLFTAGIITAQSNQPRQIQLALKLIF